jgi:hypothetical protein
VPRCGGMPKGSSKRKVDSIQLEFCHRGHL